MFVAISLISNNCRHTNSTIMLIYPANTAKNNSKKKISQITSSAALIDPGSAYTAN